MYDLSLSDRKCSVDLWSLLEIPFVASCWCDETQQIETVYKQLASRDQEWSWEMGFCLQKHRRFWWGPGWNVGSVAGRHGGNKWNV